MAKTDFGALKVLLEAWPKLWQLQGCSNDDIRNSDWTGTSCGRQQGHVEGESSLLKGLGGKGPMGGWALEFAKIEL